MDIFWDRSAWEDYQYWLTNDKKTLKKINRLIKECQRTPFTGTGKPEPLKENFSGFWSRRITGEHRLVYKVENNVLYIAQCRYHY
ncbi:toxin YoeB [Tangfeifania diversioriginum]|uniref:Putative mRNA interferase YoeB n=1 Tax=Tangfeifania diversioriginum TaxID=1168035 RepID=A0A1M6FEC0_9BACT|nr:Txe/YoeB family addiction module toxin [Tangfeifania diversioriginum]SHI95982.1 toxin YoeB [Tangfeifania diversioriginum]